MSLAERLLSGCVAALTAVALIAGAALGIVARRRKVMRSTPADISTRCLQFGAILAAAAVLSSVSHVISPGGFLRDASGVTFVRLSVASAWDIESIGDQDFIATAARGDALVIDA